MMSTAWALGLGSPLFDTIHIRLNPSYARGKMFTIITKDAAAGNHYVQSIQLNGKIIHQPFIPLQKILDGGAMVLQMGASAVGKY